MSLLSPPPKRHLKYDVSGSRYLFDWVLEKQYLWFYGIF